MKLCHKSTQAGLRTLNGSAAKSDSPSLDFITMGVCYISHVDHLYIYKQPPLPVKNTRNILFTVHCFSHKSRDSKYNNYENEHCCRNSRKMKYLQYLKVLLAVVIV